MHRVEALLLAALPRLTEEGRKALASLSWEVPPHAGQLADSVGLKNRFALMRLLREEGLPSYRELVGWIQVLAWVVEWEEHHTALARQALNAGKYPGSFYRTVRRVTGASWDEVRSRGSSWALLELLARCDPHRDGRAAADVVAG